MSSVDNPHRLRTFEVDDDETLVVLAGRGEMENRTIFQGRTSGRYAIVDVEELTASPTWKQPEYIEELNLDDLSFVGDSFVLPPEASFSYAIIGEEGEVVTRLTDPGVYHSLRVPFGRQ